MPSQEFLEEIWAEAKKYLPSWLYTTLLVTARARAGGRAKGRQAAEIKKELVACIPIVGPQDAPIAFISASPTKTELARKELFVGQAGAVFNKEYLKPLRLKRNEVLMLSTISEFVKNKIDEDLIKKWDVWLNKTLECKRPSLIVALGKTAGEILSDRCDFILPHPEAIYKYKDSGEIKRKLKQINTHLKLYKTKPLNDWKDSWSSLLPVSGKGNFIFKQNELLFEGQNSYWGFTFDSYSEAQATPIYKEVKKVSVFGNLDQGIYELGIVKENNIEIFLDGKYLNGRYSIKHTPESGDQKWLINKSDDNTPSFQSAKLADAISELRKTNQKYLFWGQPGEHELYDVRTGKTIRQSTVKITKANLLKHIVFGVVIDPYGLKGQPEGDAHNDWMPPGEIEKTAYDFMETSQVIGLQHGVKANAKLMENWVEPYPNRKEYLKAMQGKAHTITRRKFGDSFLHSGAWVLGVKLGPKEWKLYEEGKINAFSPGGFGMRKPLVPSQMPEVSIIDLVERRAS